MSDGDKVAAAILAKAIGEYETGLKDAEFVSRKYWLDLYRDCLKGIAPPQESTTAEVIDTRR